MSRKKGMTDTRRTPLFRKKGMHPRDALASRLEKSHVGARIAFLPHSRAHRAPSTTPQRYGNVRRRYPYPRHASNKPRPKRPVVLIRSSCARFAPRQLAQWGRARLAVTAGSTAPSSQSRGSLPRRIGAGRSWLRSVRVWRWPMTVTDVVRRME